MIGTETKRSLPNMNTTTNTKLTLPVIEAFSLKSQRAIKKAIQRERSHRTNQSLSRWPAEHKIACNSSTTTTANYNTSFNSDSTMKTLKTRKFFLVALGFFAVVLLGMTLVATEGLNVAGEVIGYVAGLAILGLAALDNNGTKRFI